jgi:gliding motility-associated peptidyl-prolyl isomerase
MLNSLIKTGSLFLILLATIACEEETARRPITHGSGTFLKASVERNKKIVAFEEKLIDSILKTIPNIEVIASDKGYWYYYEMEKKTDSLTPIKGDIAVFEYEIKDIFGTIIYSVEELKRQTYFVDKQKIITGLRDGIKKMKKGEIITFFFPSHIAYGYHGDKKRIGPNIPIQCTVKLIDFNKE